ncbi:SDR family oxidoreductase [Leptospira ognonensis]|uniref:dTDP-4-dehydrorhamnose reductase n=1 Tax=Leptospira ognonensis TaxID=2484945 RepID=A0A4V6QM36_9LEPT|nr:SDR family oxidoreductase [Leptospira ognonensis]TGL57206.1 SDR family oxidoreductase [Leptospira ognonensis]
MKVLVLGGSGMFGNGLVEHLCSEFEVAFTVRSSNPFKNIKATCFEYVDAFDLTSITRSILQFKPQIVINAIGVVKQKKEIQPTTSIYLNSEFPFHLSSLCELANCKLILLSTDCVFSGNKGNYSEEDIPDAIDVYGRSKVLGEHYDRANVLTIRTSTIGFELGNNKGLLEWFLSQSGTISGFAGAIYSGFPMYEFVNILTLLFKQHASLDGLFHISSEPISKFQMLTILKDNLKLKDLNIVPDHIFRCDRSLDSKKFRELTGYVPPSWNKMLETLADQIKNRKGRELGSF